MPFNKCTEIKKDAHICVKENASIFEIKNPRKRDVKKIMVDGCLMANHQKKCDWLFEIDTPTTMVFYVELKGSNISYGLEQLVSTVEFCKTNHKNIQEKYAFIVASKNRHPRASSKIQIGKKNFKKDMGVHLEVKNRVICKEI